MSKFDDERRDDRIKTLGTIIANLDQRHMSLVDKLSDTNYALTTRLDILEKFHKNHVETVAEEKRWVKRRLDNLAERVIPLEYAAKETLENPTENPTVTRPNLAAVIIGNKINLHYADISKLEKEFFAETGVSYESQQS